MTCWSSASRPKVPLPLISGRLAPGDGIRYWPLRCVLRMLSATGWISCAVSCRKRSAAGSAKNCGDQASLLVGRKRAQRVHEILRERARSSCAPLRSHSFATCAMLSAVRTSVRPIGRPVRAVAFVA